LKKYVLLLIVVLMFVGVAFAAAPTITQVSYDPTPVVPGTTATVFIQIENTEDILQEEVTITLKDEFPFTIEGEKIKNIGNINKFGKALAEFTISIEPSAETKEYDLPITISTKNQPNGVTRDYSITVSGKDPLIKAINLTQDELAPGQAKEINITLKNVGTSTAYDIILEVQEERTVTQGGIVVEREILPLGAATAYVEKIIPGGEATMQIKLLANREAELRSHVLPIEISYRKSNGERETTTSYIGINITGPVNIDSTIKENADKLIAGQPSTLTVELFNKGDGKAQYTTTDVETSIGTIARSKQFIGTLEPNDVDSFNIQITPNIETKTGEYTIELKISYQDTDAEIKTKTLSLPIKVYSIQDAGQVNPSQGISFLPILVIIVIIVAGYWIIKKKKKQK